MRILVVHNRYQQPGGEDQVVRAESALLLRKGHAVEVWEENNDAIRGLIPSALMAFKSIYSFEHARAMQQHLRHFKPDLVHIHNFFPRFSPSIHVTCRRLGVPVVQTLHNFRLLCPGATFRSTKGVCCETCAHHLLPWHAVVRKCYRQNYFASLAVANALASHRALGTWNRCVDQFIALSEFARSKFIAAGIAPGRIAVKPNFVHPDPGPGRGDGDFALFVGRLAPEKGIDSLLGAWKVLQRKPPVKIIGQGPLASHVAAAAATIPGIEWLGACDRAVVREAMAAAKILILPSTWYEGFPLVIAEAFAAGLPIIASRLGTMAEAIAHDQTGLLFTAGSATELAAAVDWVFAQPDKIAAMRQNARAEFERKYTADANYACLMAIYERALDRSPSPHQWHPNSRR